MARLSSGWRSSCGYRCAARSGAVWHAPFSWLMLAAIAAVFVAWRVVWHLYVDVKAKARLAFRGDPCSANSDETFEYCSKNPFPLSVDPLPSPGASEVVGRCTQLVNEWGSRHVRVAARYERTAVTER